MPERTPRRQPLSIATSAPVTTPIASAPAREASEPRWVTPPDVPGATAWPDSINRGARLDPAPSSVAQVSEVAAASDPPTNVSVVAGDAVAVTSAASVATPPFASTCRSSRRLPFAATTSPCPRRDNALDETKNVASTVIPRHELPADKPVPTTVAATAPRPLNASARQPARPTAADTSPPTANRRITTAASVADAAERSTRPRESRTSIRQSSRWPEN